MNAGKSVFSQIVDLYPKYRFDKLVAKYKGDHNTRHFKTWDQLLSMTFAQLTYRSSLRDIEACLTVQPQKLYHMGIRGNPSRTNLARANQNRDWKIYFELAQIMIQQARELYKSDTPFSAELDNTVYALDATTIDLCLSMFPWASFRKAKAAIKMHTLLDLKGSIPTFIEITEGSVHEIQILDNIPFELGSFYVMDRGYLDFKRLYNIHKRKSFFIVRAKKNLKFRRLYSHPVDRLTGLTSDQTIVFDGFYAKQNYPEKLRRVRTYDANSNKYLTFLSNNFDLSASLIAELYKNRWKVELFFKWIKQHLRIKEFYGTSFNAVCTQIWIGICVYVSVAIIKKKHDIPLSLYTILQIVSVTIFEKIPLNQLVKKEVCNNVSTDYGNQLTLFDY